MDGVTIKMRMKGADSMDFANISTNELGKMSEKAFGRYYLLATRPATNPSKETLLELEEATNLLNEINDEIIRRMERSCQQ